MNHRIIFLLAITVLSVFPLAAQNDTVFNQMDDMGRKQGFWKKSFPNGNMMYNGEFKDNNPVGIMKRYYENGGIQAIIIFDKKGERAKARLFYEDGELSAEGNFTQMQKDSIWRYYSFYSGVLVSEESYNNGIKNGTEKSFYENGVVSEEINWQNGTKEGDWTQYFPGGSVKMKASYNFGALNGRYYFYYDNGLIMILGNYDDNKKHGPWVFYDDKGKEKYKIEYHLGTPQGADELIQGDEEYFKMIEENIGKFEDPSIEDFFPGGGDR